MREIILKVDNVYKSFQVGQQNIEIVKGASFELKKADFLVVFGPSGCGKSTLLHTLLGLEKPTKGTVQFLGKNLYQYNEDDRSEIRKQNVGMVYQQANWIKSLTVLENVYFPLMLMGIEMEKRKERARQALKMIGMEDWADYAPTELSSGQQQKISLARALISDPVLIVADEPTGNLDSKSGEEVMGLLKGLQQKDKTIIMVTHDLEYLKYATRAIHIVDGKIVGDHDGRDRDLRRLIVSKKGNNHNDAKNAENAENNKAGSEPPRTVS